MAFTRPVILDAGPALTFCAANKQRILHDTLADIGELMTPATVDKEVRRKASTSPRFAPALKNWMTLIGSRIAVLPDEATDELVARVSRLASGTAFAERVCQSQDLGELMVMAHGLVLSEVQQLDVIVLIDEVRGARQAHSVGLKVMNTHGVLVAAARRGQIESAAHMRKVYTELRKFDDGLVHISQTRLLEHDNWLPRTPSS
jgi:hypothetical protein